MHNLTNNFTSATMHLELSLRETHGNHEQGQILWVDPHLGEGGT